MSSKKERRALPGETLAVVEEFEPGEGTYSIGESIKASSLGMAEFDLKQRKVIVKSPVKKQILPSKGNTVEGVVETAQPSVANIRITSINGEQSNANFSAMLTAKQDMYQRRQRRSIIAKPGDLIRATVISTKNAIIQLSLENQKDGVLTSICSVCGGGVIKINDRVKCKECGYVEERALSPDFITV